MARNSKTVNAVKLFRTASVTEWERMQRLYDRLSSRAKSECWVWQASDTAYTTLFSFARDHGRHISVLGCHLIWLMEGNPFPDWHELPLNGECFNKMCCNPGHRKLRQIQPPRDLPTAEVFRANYLDAYEASVGEPTFVPGVPRHLGPCHLWKKAIDKNTGYAKFPIGRTPDYDWVTVPSAHSIAYLLANGKLPKTIKKNGVEMKVTVGHKCDVRACVNPAHLEMVTHRQQVLDSWDRTRRNPKAMRYSGTAIATRAAL